jgi:hypothetical protein
MGLYLHVTSGGAAVNDPQTVMAWMISDDGRLFVTESSERWYEANVAAGTDETEARTARDRVTAAYLAPPQ